MTPAQITAARRTARAKAAEPFHALMARQRLATGVSCPCCGWEVDEMGNGHASDTCAGIRPNADDEATHRPRELPPMPSAPAVAFDLDAPALTVAPSEK